MAEYRVEMSFNWRATPTVYMIAEQVRSTYLPQYQAIAQKVGATVDSSYYSLQNGLVRLVDGTGQPQWFTKLQSHDFLSFYFFDNTREQRAFKLALPIIAFTSQTMGQPQEGVFVYPIPPIDANHLAEEQYENPWTPRLNKPSLLDPSFYSSTFELSWMQGSRLPAWWVVDNTAATSFDLIRTGVYQLSIVVGVLGPDAEGNPDKLMKIFGFDPEMVVGPGATEGGP